MDRQSNPGRSGSMSHGSGRQNQRGLPGRISTDYARYVPVSASSSSSSHAPYPLAQQAPSKQLMSQNPTISGYHNSYAPLGFSDSSDFFSSGQGLSRPVSVTAAQNIRDQSLCETGPQDFHAHVHDEAGSSHAPTTLDHFSYFQPQDAWLHLPSSSSHTGSSGAALSITEPESSSQGSQDGATLAHGHHKGLSLTEAQRRDLDESGNRLMRDYSGNNPAAQSLLFGFCRAHVSVIRASRGPLHLMPQGSKQKEYTLIIPTGEAGPKGGHNSWKCNLCRDDQVNTFQKVAGHFISKHFHAVHPKPYLWICDQVGCTRGYSGLNELNRHKNSEHGLPMPGAKTPAATPSPAASDYPSPAGPGASTQKRMPRPRQIKPRPYPDSAERRSSHVASAPSEMFYANSQLAPPPAPSSSRVPPHGSHFQITGSNTHPTYNAPTVHGLLSQGYGASTLPSYLSMNQPGQTGPSMPTAVHYSPAGMNPPMSPAPSMPMPMSSLSNFGTNINWSPSDQYLQSFYQSPQEGAPPFSQQ